MAHRDAVDLIEAVTWSVTFFYTLRTHPNHSSPSRNDFGESTYLTPTSRGTDSTNQVWAAGLEHSSLLTVNLYYSQAWKTGNYPTISKDVIHLSARPHPNGAKASSDPVGPPAGGSTGGNVAGPQWVRCLHSLCLEGKNADYVSEQEIDSFFALIFSTGSASVTMTSGTFSNTFTVAGGVTHLSSPLQPGYRNLPPIIST